MGNRRGFDEKIVRIELLVTTFSSVPHPSLLKRILLMIKAFCKIKWESHHQFKGIRPQPLPSCPSLDVIEDDFLGEGLSLPIKTIELEKGWIKETHHLEHIIQQPLFQHMAPSHHDGEECGFDSKEDEVVTRVEEVSLVDEVLEGIFDGEGDDDFAMGDGDMDNKEEEEYDEEEEEEE
uniref:Uncharacterized protein n=1 Tax=Tanacetum cinerariifolium TaxID=118510 RepID=A0A699GW02_TANCI|nr:hypothetical protein [Tanacetum cinerariifolium]